MDRALDDTGRATWRHRVGAPICAIIVELTGQINALGTAEKHLKRCKNSQNFDF